MFLLIRKCCFLRFILIYNKRDSLLESKSFNYGTFPSQQGSIGDLAIYISSKHPEIVPLGIDKWFPDGKHFKDAVLNFAIK